MDRINAILDMFFSFKAYVMLPIIIFIIALIGALVDNLTGSFLLGLVAVLLLALYSFKLIEWTAPDVERETGLTGVSASPVSVNGLIPYAVVMDALFERIPGFRRLEYNPSKHDEGKTSLLGEPMIIGLLIGLLLSVAAGYDIKGILETGIHIAAVMFLLPVSSGLIGEGMQPITVQLREKVEARFPERRNLVIALDTGILMKNRSIMVTGLILMPIALVISLILPGNRTLPLGDLPNLISVMALSVLLFRGNVLRAVIAGIPVVVTYLLIASKMAPLFTALAGESGALEETGMEITAFTDGGNQFRYLLYELFQGKLWSFIALALLLLSLFLTWKRYKRTAAELTV